MERMKKQVTNLLNTSNNSDGNINSKFKLPKLISFLSLIKKVILNDLRDENEYRR